MMDHLQRNSIREKFNKIFDSHVITDNSEALNVISGLYSPNSNNSRRILLNEIEKRDMLVNKTVLSEFNKVKEKLQVLLNSLESLHVAVEDMSNRLHESKTKTHHLISQTISLHAERKKTEKKAVWTNALVTKFQVSVAQKENINNFSTKAPLLTSDIFSTLCHLETLYNNCKILMKCWYQTSAFEIMEMVSLQQEISIEKLYHWTIGACRNLDSPNKVLAPRAVAKFQERPVLFSNIIDEYSTARKSTIVQFFIDALTKGDFNSKPIEFYANDIKRYMGDILTWVYQVIPIEKENLSNLFKYCNMNEINEHFTKTLINIMEAICPLLKVRAELILKPDKDPLALWSVTNLIVYYRDVIQLSVPNGHLIDTLNELYQKSESVFLIALDSKIQKELSHGVKAPPSDLSPSIVVTDLVSYLRDLLTVINTTNNISKGDGKIIITHILDPLLHAINETACHLSSTDMSVYMLNCIYHIQCTLLLYTIMDEYNERLQAQSEAQIDTLTSEQASYFVANLNLGPIYTILQEKTNGPLSAIPGMDSMSLKSFLNKFELFLGSPDIYILPQLKLLISQTHKSVVKKRAFEVILAIYTQLFIAVYDPNNGYVDPQMLMRRDVDEIKKLLV